MVAVRLMKTPPFIALSLSTHFAVAAVASFHLLLSHEFPVWFLAQPQNLSCSFGVKHLKCAKVPTCHARRCLVANALRATDGVCFSVAISVRPTSTHILGDRTAV